MRQTLIVASSEQDAITLSSKGFHLMSRTGPRCPVTFGVAISIRPVWRVGMTRNEPPPHSSVTIATNFGLIKKNLF
jgi:hypothetical protein